MTYWGRSKQLSVVSRESVVRIRGWAADQLDAFLIYVRKIYVRKVRGRRYRDPKLVSERDIDKLAV